MTGQEEQRMALLEVRPEEMRSRAATLAAIGEEDQEIMRQMRVIVMSLEEVWRGTAQESFVASFLSAGARMTELSAMIGDLAALMRQAAAETENEDAALQGMIAGI